MTSTEKKNLISYKLGDKHAYGISEQLNDGCDTVITVIPKISGFVLIGAFTHELLDGVCRPDLRMLKDGEHTVSFHTEDSVISADKLIKSGCRICLESKGESEIKRLRGELISVQNELVKISDDISKIYQKINETSIL